jgi:hypothetical protein
MSTAILTDDFDADHPSEAHFSVVIHFEEGQASSDESRPAYVSTLAADLIGEQFVRTDQRFLVMEGDKKVAIGEVASLDQAD